MIEVFYDVDDNDTWVEHENRTNLYYRWLIENVGKENKRWQWHSEFSAIIFDNEADALIFKLTFEL